MTDCEFLLNDLRDNGDQSSWDWQADYRFSIHIGNPDLISDCKSLIDSQSVFGVRIGAWKALTYVPVTMRRMRALRVLVNSGLVDSGWDGTGVGGVNSFGVNRTRWYSLRQQDGLGNDRKDRKW